MPIDRASRPDVEAWLATHAEENRRYRGEEAFERIYMPRQAAHEVPTDALPELYDFAAATIGDVPLLYLEFGVFDGRSISRIAERFCHSESRFVGFDSFEGLPEDWVLPWQTMPRGAFSRGGAVPVLPDPRISFVRGWFQNTLRPFLANGGGKSTGPVLVHYDADLYSSTLFILSTLWDRISEYYFIFDEFLEHELVALYDFSLAFPIELEFLCQTNAGGYPNQVFGRMRRMTYTPD